MKLTEEIIKEAGKANGVNIISVKEIKNGVFDILYETPDSVDAIDYLRNDKSLNLDKIEKELGMPQAHLSRAINNKRALPKEWEVALKKYLLNKAETIKQQLS